MRCRWISLWLFLFIFSALTASAAEESESEAELRILQERLAGIEAVVEQRKKLAAGKVSTAEGPNAASGAEGRDVASYLSAFIEKVDVSGLVAAGGSWQRESQDATPTVSGSSEDYGTFQLYQAWIEIDKTPTEESRAGFNLSIEMGDMTTQTESGSFDVPGIFSAYVSYLVPLGQGLRVDAGILPTALGAEHEKQSLNWNITRGLVFYLQPITSTGVTMKYLLTESLSLMVGAINDPIASGRRDTFTQKALTGQLVFSRPTWGFKAGVNYGRSAGRTLRSFDPYLPPVPVPSRYRAGIYDFVFTWNPYENLGFWANFDYHFGRESDGQNAPGTKALAAALRLGATETVGFSFRYEWIAQDTSDQTRYQTFTATIDRRLTDSLISKAEYRYEQRVDLSRPKLKVNGVFFQFLYEF